MRKGECKLDLTGTGYCASFNFRRTARAVTRMYDATMQKSGIRSTQFAILVGIAKNQPIAIGALGKILVIEQTTLTRSLQLLRKDGLITTSKRSAMRQRFLEMTPNGEQALARALPYWRRMQSEFQSLQRMSADEVTLARREADGEGRQRTAEDRDLLALGIDTELVAVEREPSLETQGIASAEPDRHGAGGDQRVPELRPVVGADEELERDGLSRVARARDARLMRRPSCDRSVATLSSLRSGSGSPPPSMSPPRMSRDAMPCRATIAISPVSSLISTSGKCARCSRKWSQSLCRLEAFTTSRYSPSMNR